MKIKQFILTLFYGKTAPSIPFKEGCKTRYPQERPILDEWTKEFNVGSMWDRKVVHLEP